MYYACRFEKLERAYVVLLLNVPTLNKTFLFDLICIQGFSVKFFSADLYQLCKLTIHLYFDKGSHLNLRSTKMKS